jgi:hypothetical protein
LARPEPEVIESAEASALKTAPVKKMDRGKQELAD